MSTSYGRPDGKCLHFAIPRRRLRPRCNSAPLIRADQPYEQGLGCEDPNIVFFEGRWYIFYTAVEWHHWEGEPFEAKRDRIALAVTDDWKRISKLGVVSPDVTSKAAAIFPERLAEGRIGLLWTVDSDTPDSSILIAYPDDLTPSAIRAALERSLTDRAIYTILPAQPSAALVRRGRLYVWWTPGYKYVSLATCRVRPLVRYLLACGP